MIDKKIKIVAIVGPTACGKTKLSIELAKIFGGEIVSADSIQIYKFMDIGTAKPTKNEMQEVPHHLIDFLDLNKEFSVAEYVKLAKNCIKIINKNDKLPIIVGGTGLYIDSLLNNVSFITQKFDPELRKNLENKLKYEGINSLISELALFDKKSAQNIHPNNVKRIIRAIEIYKISGITMSQQIENSKKIASPYDTIMIGLNYKNRDNLYKNINNRVEKMMNLGLLNEAKKILSMKCSKTAMSAICYKELKPYFCGFCTINEAVENLKKQTRRYAKRQLTWFKRNKKINWIFIDEFNNFDEILNKCINIIKSNFI